MHGVSCLLYSLDLFLSHAGLANTNILSLLTILSSLVSFFQHREPLEDGRRTAGTDIYGLRPCVVKGQERTSLLNTVLRDDLSASP